MIEEILTALRWSLSIGNKIFRVVPNATLIVVMATLVSQFSMVLASLLPLKVLMLLGSTRVPRYFPDFFAGVDRDLLVVSLGLLAVGFFIVHLLAEKVITYGASRGAELLLQKSQKMTLFENQSEIAGQGYQRYSRSLASSILIALISVGISFVYPGLALVLALYILAAFLILGVLYSAKGKVKEGLDTAPGKIVGIATNIGFLIAFSFMVWQFLWGYPPGLLIAIVSLILMRQGFSRITGLVTDLKGIYSQRFKLNALFFHGHVLVSETKKHETTFWSLFRSPNLERWVSEVLENIYSQPVQDCKIEWFQLGAADVVALRVNATDSEGECLGECLIKVFNSNKTSLAKHEATLLYSESGLPALPLLGVDEIDGMHCHVFQWCDAEKISLNDFKSVKQSLMILLMTLEPEGMLASRFSRSRPPLWQRLDKKMCERLETVAKMLGGDYVTSVEDFSARKNCVVAKLKNLPWSFFIPDIGVDSILKQDNGEFFLVHWGRWSLEPIGAGLPVHNEQLEKVSEIFLEAREARSELHQVEEKDIQLSALVFEMERLCSRQQFLLAIKLIPEILACVEEESEKTPLAESKA